MLAAFAFPDWNCWPAIFLSLSPLCAAVTGKDVRCSGDGFRLAWLQGAVFFVLLLYWLAPTIARYGGIPLPLAWLLFFSLAFFLALFHGVWGMGFSWLYTRLMARNDFCSPMLLMVAGAALWTLLSWVRSWLLTGFPWGILAYGLASMPELIQTASFWGVWGVDFTAAIIPVSLWGIWMLRRQRRSILSAVFPMLAAILVFVAGWSFRFLSLPDKADSIVGKSVCVCAVQGSFDQFMKWNPEILEETVDRYLHLTYRAITQGCHRPGDASIVVWPETAMPFYFQDPGQERDRILNFVQKNKIYLLTGSPAYRRGKDGRISYLNSAWLIAPDGSVDTYSKQHLVPFGEYLPLGPVTNWVRDLLPTAGDFVPGRKGGPVVSGPVKIGVLICFESIFPEISRKAVAQGANILAVITNDAWFGETSAPWQHAEMAVFRAVETRRWVVRAANTGTSQVIDPEGRVRIFTPLFKPDFACSTAYLSSEKTFYVTNGSIWFIVLMTAVIIVASLFGLRQPVSGKDRPDLT